MDYLSDDIRRLRVTLSQVQTNQSNVQVSQADVITHVKTLSSELTGIMAQFEDQRTRISLLFSRLDDMEADISGRLTLLAELISESDLAKVPKPSTILKTARQDYQRGRMDSANKWFGMLIEKYPKVESAGEAQFYLAEIAFHRKKFEDAVESYDIVLSSYSLSSYVPAAYYKKAMTLEELERPQEALEIYRIVVQKYAGRKESQMSVFRIQALE